jgi:hypothetical protein
MEKEKMDNLIDEEVLVDSVTLVAEEETIGEGENAKKQICFKGVFSEADTLNANKRIYPKNVLRSVFTEAIERSKATKKPIFGELEHAKDAHVNLERIAVKFPELVWDEETGQIKGKAVPAGPMKASVITLAEDGFPICFSTRMTGKTKPLSEERRRQLNITEENAVEVCEGAKLISIDVVGNQSCQKAISDTVYEETLTEESKKPTFKSVFDALI